MLYERKNDFRGQLFEPESKTDKVIIVFMRGEGKIISASLLTEKLANYSYSALALYYCKGKGLSNQLSEIPLEMSLKELWQLYPIFLTEHKDCWKSWYADEEAVLKKSIPQTIRINHIGSTALNLIWAKPIIDILVEVPRECDLVVIKNLLIENSYTFMSQCADRISFNKGYTSMTELAIPMQKLGLYRNTRMMPN